VFLAIFWLVYLLVISRLLVAKCLSGIRAVGSNFHSLWLSDILLALANRMFVAFTIESGIVLFIGKMICSKYLITIIRINPF
jgi:hypothetical protein